jgi:hypothetical protein
MEYTEHTDFLGWGIAPPQAHSSINPLSLVRFLIRVYSRSFAVKSIQEWNWRTAARMAAVSWESSSGCMM